MKIRTTHYLTVLFVFTTSFLCNAQSIGKDSLSMKKTLSTSLLRVGGFWSLNGNSGTNTDENFIGTTDSRDLIFKNNNVFSGKLGFVNTSFGYNVGQGGFYNVNIGRSAGSNSSNRNNINNVSIGENAGKSNISGSLNTFVGSGTGMLNSTGEGNTFIGANAGRYNTIGNSNTALGYQSFSNNSSGSNNIAISNSALELNKTGNNNIALGVWSLQSNVLGNYNIGIGQSAGQLSTGSHNVFLGEAAGNVLRSGDSNLFFGYYSAHSLESGERNIFIGAGSGYYSKLGSNNLFLGNNSGVNSGSKNIAIGDTAGGKVGNGNILLGNSTSINPGFQLNPLNDNILNIGNVIFGYNMNRISSIDNTSLKLGKIGINTTTPNTALEIKSESKGDSGLRFTNLTSSFNPPLSTNDTKKFLSVDLEGDVILQNMPDISINNQLSSNVNMMTNSVNGSSSSAPIVNSISNTLNSSNQLITTVNGVASNPITIPAFSEVDGSVTNELQSLSLSGNTVSISNGNSITLPSTVVTAGNNVTVTGNGSPSTPYVVSSVNTDNQSLTLVGNNLSISNGNTVVLPAFTEVDGSLTNELQTLSQAGNVVTLSNNGGSFTLPTLVDTSIYGDNGSINQATTINNNRVVNMNSRNIWFNTATSPSNGNIYIGSSTSYPNTTGSYKLFVEGGILTEKVKVALRSTANWADYVFEKDYKLMPLNEVEKYISKNKHLPGVDSASDLSKNGLDLAEMQAKHMEKIEELTLYTIEQNKKIELQEIEIKKTNKEVEELKAQVKALIEKTK
jgi:hypothetical protein